MSSYNSVPPIAGGTAGDVIEALGITQFPSATEWYQVIGGIIVQGGRVSIASGVTATVNLVAPYGKQFLGAWIQVIDVASNNAHITAVSLNSFQIVNGVGLRAYYWLSLGV